MAKRGGKKPVAGDERPVMRRDKAKALAGSVLARREASARHPESRMYSGASDRPERVVVTLRGSAGKARSGRPAARGERRPAPSRRGGTLRLGLTVPARPTSETDADEIEAPSEEEVSRAVDTLMRLSAARADEQWERAVEGLHDSPTLDADRLYQAQQHATLRHWVLDEVDLLGPGEIAALLPHRVGTDSNVARAVDRLRERGELLAVRYKDVWRYPSDQISAKGEVHASIPGTVVRARAQGYDPWEIVYRLARPTETPPPAFVGRPLEHDGRTLSLDALFAEAGELVPDSASAESVQTEIGPSPFEMLAAGDDDAFERAVLDWLGQDAP